MQQLDVFQSLWAMERRHTDGVEQSLEENVATIAAAGFDGVSAHGYDPIYVKRLAAELRSYGLRMEGQCFPKTVADLEPVVALAGEYGFSHVCLQADVRPRRLEDCLPLLDGWQRLAADAGVPVYVETHRDRMTTDLFFTLDLLDRMPDLRFVADLSHYLVGREFAWPMAEESHLMVHRILDNAWAFHGRVASREQVQIEISFPHHRPWVDLFLDWWNYGFRSWRRRSGADDTLVFVCELGPKPYAITGRDGNDTTDRWEEALAMASMARALWARVQGEDQAASRDLSLVAGAPS